MSAIAFDRTGFETETSRTAPVSRPRPRDEEFRAALDRYMADYIAQREALRGRPGMPPPQRDSMTSASIEIKSASPIFPPISVCATLADARLDIDPGA